MPADLGNEFPTRINVSLDETRVPMTDIQHRVYLQVERIANQAAPAAAAEGAPGAPAAAPVVVSNAFLNKTRQYCNTVHKVPEKFPNEIKAAVRTALATNPDSVEPK